MQLNYAVNALLSINVVVALLVALILDNTVPGSRHLDRSQIPRGGSCDIGTLPIAGEGFVLVQVGKVCRHLKALRSGGEDSIYSIGTLLL